MAAGIQDLMAWAMSAMSAFFSLVSVNAVLGEGSGCWLLFGDGVVLSNTCRENVQAVNLS